ncbi:MAG TPA: metal-dependent hydrolase [Candidatus Acidoferrum sp.]|jgi:inner membrane protein
MASLISHAVAALGIGTAFARPGLAKRVWVLGAICSMVPDIDVLGFKFGIRYGDFWGHRGFSHSLLFAAILATLASVLGFIHGPPGLGKFSLWTYLFLASASHAFLDAMTNGGLGVAFFSPIDNTRYFLPWRPILVSPISITRFFSERGLAVLLSELTWIWIPAGFFAFAAFAVPRFKSRPSVMP